MFKVNISSKSYGIASLVAIVQGLIFDAAKQFFLNFTQPFHRYRTVFKRILNALLIFEARKGTLKECRTLDSSKLTQFVLTLRKFASINFVPIFVTLIRILVRYRHLLICKQDVFSKVISLASGMKQFAHLYIQRTCRNNIDRFIFAVRLTI